MEYCFTSFSADLNFLVVPHSPTNENLFLTFFYHITEFLHKWVNKGTGPLLHCVFKEHLLHPWHKMSLQFQHVVQDPEDDKTSYLYSSQLISNLFLKYLISQLSQLFNSSPLTSLPFNLTRLAKPSPCTFINLGINSIHTIGISQVTPFHCLDSWHVTHYVSKSHLYVSVGTITPYHNPLPHPCLLSFLSICFNDQHFPALQTSRCLMLPCPQMTTRILVIHFFNYLTFQANHIDSDIQLLFYMDLQKSITTFFPQLKNHNCTSTSIYLHLLPPANRTKHIYQLLQIYFIFCNQRSIISKYYCEKTLLRSSIVVPTVIYVSKTWRWNERLRIKAAEMSNQRCLCQNRTDGNSNKNIYGKS